MSDSIGVHFRVAERDDNPYNLESLKLPKLAGNSLRLVAAALSFGPTRSLLLGRLLRDGGITKIRNLRLDETPTMYPLPAEATDTAAPRAPSDVARPTSPLTTAAEIGAAYLESRMTPTDVAERSLSAIEQSDSGELPLAAFISVLRSDVLEQAEASSKRFAAGTPLGPLDGVPIAIKDEIDQVPHPTTVGTSFLGAEAASEDSCVVARLRAAGAVLIGKANMHEIGFNPNGLNVHYGVTRNPYDRRCDPGGSSSGSAAAVASGICPVSIGADGGGSVRIPAALCGMVGLKATFGRISEFGAAPLTWSMGHLGPIGASVLDCLEVYRIIAGHDSGDPRTLKGPLKVSAPAEADLDGSLHGVRLGIFEPWFAHATDEVVAANRTALDALCARGAELVNIEVPELDEMRVAHAVTILAEIATAMQNHRENLGKLGAGVRINLTIGAALTGIDYMIAQRMRTRALAIFDSIYRKVDAIVTPATATVAPPIPKKAMPHGWSDLSAVTELMRYVVPGNLIGLPAMSFPVGYNPEGLPIAMQAMSRHWNESVLFRIARAAEHDLERSRPPGYVDLLEAGS